MPATAFHGTPLTPNHLLRSMEDRSFCVSFYRPDQVEIVAEIARSWFIDCGAFSAWTKGLVLDAAYWERYYAFVRHWLARSLSLQWFVIPDVIDAGTQEQDAMIRDCPVDLIDRGWPVYHLDEPISRALRLIERFGRLCIGATGDYRVIPSPAFCARMDELFAAIYATFGFIPPVHMFRGLQILKPEFDWPIITADSTHLARNHNRLERYGPERRAWALKQWADRWDGYALARTQTWPPPRLIVPADLFAA